MSSGRWEKDTLVVETTNFTSQGVATLTFSQSGGTDENEHLIERFTRTGPDTLLYEFTITDPTTWTRPWSAAVPMKKTDEHIYEYACHEGNISMETMLAAARQADKASDGAAKKTGGTSSPRRNRRAWIRSIRGGDMRTNSRIVAVSAGLFSPSRRPPGPIIPLPQNLSRQACDSGGSVTKMEWINPHAWIYIDVTGPDGKVETWGIEAGSPNVLLRRGFNKNMLELGTVIKVRGFGKDGARKANGGDMTLPNGKTLLLGSSGTGAPAPEDEKKK